MNSSMKLLQICCEDDLHRDRVRKADLVTPVAAANLDTVSIQEGPSSAVEAGKHYEALEYLAA